MCRDASSCSHCCQRAEDLQNGYHRVHCQHLKVVYVKAEASDGCSWGKPGWVMTEYLRQMWPTQWEPSQWHSPLPTINHQTWLQLSLHDPVPVWAHSFDFSWFSAVAKVIKQEALLRQRLDPGMTFVKVVLQMGTICQTSSILFRGNEDVSAGTTFSRVIFYCWLDVQAEIYSVEYSSIGLYKQSRRYHKH